jgi:dTDP-4-dehydrorhamnose reductase
MAADVLLFGAGGTLGHVAARVLASRFDLLAPVRQTSGNAPAFDVLQSDEVLAVLLGRLKPGGLIVNTVAVLGADIPTDAGPAIRERVLAVNALFPHRVARLAERSGHRIVHVSTDAVFSAQAGGVTETDAIAPQDLYGISKAAGELPYPHTLTIRCSLVGPPAPGRARGLWAWVAGAKQGVPLRGYTNQLWSGLTTLQFAETCAALADPKTFDQVRRHGAIHHLAPNPVVSKHDLVCELARALRPDLAVEPAIAGTAICRILVSRYSALSAITPRYPDWKAAIAAAAAAQPDATQ